MSLNQTVSPTLTTKVDRLNSRDPSVDQGGQNFSETLQKISKNEVFNQIPSSSRGPGTSGIQSIKFSNHAIERMQSRGITLKGEDLARLNEAVARAATKGSKDSLVLMNDSAFIVSVKNNTVVTVMDKNSLKENVFTNIDSTIVM